MIASINNMMRRGLKMPSNGNECLKKQKTKELIKTQVLRFKQLGLTDTEIIHWIEHTLNPKLELLSLFATIEELANFTDLPKSLFRLNGFQASEEDPKI